MIKSKVRFAFYVLSALIMIITYPAAISAQENGYDFVEEVTFLYGVLACGDVPLPDNIDKSVIKENCTIFKQHVESFRKSFVDPSSKFFASVRPAGLPKTAVYPFGGSDMVSAFVTYPDADEIITISLESSGDPRRLMMAGPEDFKEAVAKFREMSCNTMTKHDNTNPDVRAFERGIIPCQLAFSLAAAYAYGYEPVSLKYFKINDNGSLDYYDLKKIAAVENVIGKKLASFWVDTDYSIAFRNMEVKYRKKSTGKIIVHRHIGANLDNKHFTGSGLEKYLKTKGKISAMTKAASYLYWFDDFSGIRDYTLANMSYMISDATGILPRHALKAGFEMTTYGRFHGAFLDDNGGEKAEEFKKLWNSQPYRPVNFRYGYSDTLGSNHVVIYRSKVK